MRLQILAAMAVRLRTNKSQTAQAIDICIVGAGVVGLALARELVNAFPSTNIVVLEKLGQIGQETSSRNSEVIHAGIYYLPGSLKARSCIRGRELLYQYCEQQHIPYRRIGKLIVAPSSQVAALEHIQQRALANGVDSLQFLDKNQIHRLEPCVRADIALWSPDTGIIDSHSLMTSFVREAEAKGVILALRSELVSAEVLGNNSGFKLQIQSGTEAMTLVTKVLINSAGLHAVAVGNSIEGVPPSSLPVMDFIKGNYMSLSGKSPFSHLIYPTPDSSQRGLGIHATLDLAGQCRFGPDIEPVTNLDYKVDMSRITLFEKAIRQYFPSLDASRLQAAYSGIRPRIKIAPDASADFVIQDSCTHGVAGLWQLFGIESPGLTASMALAEYIRELIQESALLSTS